MTVKIKDKKCACRNTYSCNAIITLLNAQKNIQNSQTLIEWVIEQYGRQPFLILVACLLSLRARDSQVQKQFPMLVDHIRTPGMVIHTPINALENLLYSVGFYKIKSRTLLSVSQELINRYASQVPDTLDELLSITGIGRKTANIVLYYAFGVPTIAVDVHVHRVSNRLGIVCTQKPEESEAALMSCVEKKWWHLVNRSFVLWGQQICVPRSPHCSLCALKKYCCYYKNVQKYPKK